MRKKISIKFPSDSNGMVPRQCPHCSKKFKVNADQFSEREYLNLRCPYCRFIYRNDEFITEEQKKYAETVGQNQLRQMMEGIVEESLEEIFEPLKSNDFLEVSTDTDDVFLGEKTMPSTQFQSEIHPISCDNCEFSFAVSEQIEQKSIYCPVCRD